MKLMDKFHSPKIKRTPSKKGKQSAPEPAIKSTEKPVNKVITSTPALQAHYKLYSAHTLHKVYTKFCKTLNKVFKIDSAQTQLK